MVISATAHKETRTVTDVSRILQLATERLTQIMESELDKRSLGAKRGWKRRKRATRKTARGATTRKKRRGRHKSRHKKNGVLLNARGKPMMYPARSKAAKRRWEKIRASQKAESA